MYRLTTSLPYLLNRVGVRISDLFERELAADGLTVPMYRVIAALAERPEQRLSDLSIMVGVELAALSRMVAGMEKRRLLRRRRPPENLRTINISLTAAGRALAARLLPRGMHYEQVAMRSLDEAAIATLKAQLVTIFANLDALDTEMTAPTGRSEVA